MKLPRTVSAVWPPAVLFSGIDVVRQGANSCYGCLFLVESLGMLRWPDYESGAGNADRPAGGA